MLIQTRVATLQESSLLYGLYVEAMKAHIEQIWGWDEDWQKNDFATALNTISTNVIQFNNELIGYYQLEQAEDHDYLRMFILDKQHRSKGIGSIILQRLLEQSQTKHSTLKLRVFKINTAALRFYQREGWQVIKVEDAFYYLDYKTPPKASVKETVIGIRS
jgi:GNAT superfamily N-acetyltransferase